MALIACDGGPTTTDEDAGAQPDGSVDCAGSADGTACGSGRTCMSGVCVSGGCGDGLVDDVGGEQCDDANDVAFDGCTSCQFDCTSNAHCDDGDPCSGDERCNIDTHACEAGTGQTAGTPCSSATVTDGVCRDMAGRSQCVPTGCGNGVTDGAEQCDDGANGNQEDGCRDDCTFSCALDADCDDADICTGMERCDVSTHRCVAGTPLDCSDGDECTEDLCDAASGCANPLIDADGDGHAPVMASCGTDCNDANNTVNPDATELCDTVDNDCDGMTDELAPVWYVDCDRDGYAPSTEGSMQACTMPIAAPSSCTGPGSWTNLEPIDMTTTDCLDTSLDARPGAFERCDRSDNDCDGFVDDDQLYFTRSPAAGSRPDLSDGFRVAYNPLARQFAAVYVVRTTCCLGESDDDLEIALMDAEGAPLDEVQVISDPEDFALTVVGGDFVVAWARSSSISFARVDSSGTLTHVGGFSAGYMPTPDTIAIAPVGTDQIAVVWGNGQDLAGTLYSLTTRTEVSGARVDELDENTRSDDELHAVGIDGGIAVIWRARTASGTNDQRFRTLTAAGAGPLTTLEPWYDAFELTYDASSERIVLVHPERVGTTSSYTLRARTIDPATAAASPFVDIGTTYSTSGPPTVFASWVGEPGQIAVLIDPNDGDARAQVVRVRVADGAAVPTPLRVDLGFEGLMIPSLSGVDRLFFIRDPTRTFEVGQLECLP